MNVSELFEWVSLVASIAIVIGWIAVFRRFWPTMLIHMGSAYTYLIPVVLVSGASLRIARGVSTLVGGDLTIWYVIFGIWIASSFAAIHLFLMGRTGR